MTPKKVEEGRKRQNGRSYRPALTHDCDKVPWIKKHNIVVIAIKSMSAELE